MCACRRGSCAALLELLLHCQLLRGFCGASFYQHHQRFLVFNLSSSDIPLILIVIMKVSLSHGCRFSMRVFKELREIRSAAPDGELLCHDPEPASAIATCQGVSSGVSLDGHCTRG